MYHTANVTSPFPSWYPMCRSDFKDVFTSKYYSVLSVWCGYVRHEPTSFLINTNQLPLILSIPLAKSLLFVDAATLTEVYPCFFLSCKANARVNLAKTGHGQGRI